MIDTKIGIEPIPKISINDERNKKNINKINFEILLVGVMAFIFLTYIVS